jgi:hypothetical protein
MDGFDTHFHKRNQRHEVTDRATIGHTIVGTGEAGHANSRCMTKMQTTPVAGFTPGERDYIRRELDMFFSTLPTVAEGFQLKNWRGGPEAGKPKLSPIAKGLLQRGLMRLDTSQHLPRLFFTEGSPNCAG